jgi:ribosomal subunit interface protein
MDLIVKGRGIHITDQLRRTIEHKLAKVERLEPRVLRVEVEVIEERNPRIDGSHRVEVACETTREVFRAEGTASEVETALDQMIEHLERQITSRRGKLRRRWTRRGNRLQSPRTSPEESGSSE